ncbi:cellulose synthase complex outer membrane protein BcsC [Martelella alba]|uniref:cellulose synthase complex outer membrane protein BcsC n=1 Tax=Martelella alba TaxID=2590451 RepID=UPI001E3F7279|nr:cellulose synthase complex outer membrane protein BcsC [Martelella alba]
MNGADRYPIRLALLAVFLLAPVAAADEAPQQWLLTQVRVGEADHNDVLVRQSLYRLELIAPENPEVVAAALRLALRQGNLQEARRRLARLRQLAPDSPLTRRAQNSLALTEPAGRQQLQQARLLAAAGRLAEAKNRYDALFQGDLPTLDMAVEYWRLVSRLPGRQDEALRRLLQWDARYPGNAELRLLAAKLLLAEHRNAEGYQLLGALAGDPAGRGAAAELWLNDIRDRPVSAASLAELQRFIDRFEDGPPVADAKRELARRRALLADPRYQARLRGMAMVARGEGRRAIAPLQVARMQSPNDADVLGALGLAYARAGRRQGAIALFEQAQRVDRNGFRGNKWRSLIAANRYWLQIDQGDRALKARDYGSARRHYALARTLDDSDGQSWVGLGQVAQAQGDNVQARDAFQRALRIEPDNGGALRGLADIYRRQSPARELAFLEGLGPAQRALMHDEMIAARVELLSRQGRRYADLKQWPQAEETYRRALDLSPGQAWLVYSLAQALRNDGRLAQADALFPPLFIKSPIDTDAVYAYGLYLSSTGRPRQALLALHRVPVTGWSQGMRELANHLQAQIRRDDAVRLRGDGHETAAVALLSRPPVLAGNQVLLADWAMARADYVTALADYRYAARLDPAERDGQLGEIDALLALGRTDEARHRLAAVTAALSGADSLSTRRRIAGQWRDAGEPAKGLALLRELRPEALRQGVSMDAALTFRDSERLERQQGKPRDAWQDAARAMTASGITAAPPADYGDFTFLTRTQASDDWLKRGIRRDAAELARQQDGVVTLDQDNSTSNGSGGTSDYTARTTQLQADMPFGAGRAFLRADRVQVSAGTFAASNGVYHEVFGACADVGCRADTRQNAAGTSLAAGWGDSRWQGDVGSTPLGFAVEDWVGGLSYSDDWRHIGWTLTASRRPLSNSLLAFGGARDPVTGITWGGVRASGVNAALSYDRGGADGVWSNVGAQRLTGRNVADNQRVRVMTGYYHKMINDDDRRLTVGLNGMWWHYQKDLSGYALGQGGYYSPQRYVSLAVPINYRQRRDNWSWQLGGTLGWSAARTDDHPRYPLPDLIPPGTSDRNAIEAGGSSTGVGYTLQALIERRLSAHWFLGAGVDIQQAKDYTPSHGLIYVRYSLAGWLGDLDSPPQPLTRRRRLVLGVTGLVPALIIKAVVLHGEAAFIAADSPHGIPNHQRAVQQQVAYRAFGQSQPLLQYPHRLHPQFIAGNMHRGKWNIVNLGQIKPVHTHDRHILAMPVSGCFTTISAKAGLTWAMNWTIITRLTVAIAPRPAIWIIISFPPIAWRR